MFKSITTLLTLLMTSSLTSSIYDIPLVDIDGKTTTLSSYKNKVLLIVNVASKCGFTRQYSGLEELHQTYHSRGLVVLGFPCNQFAGQEPGDEKQIKNFCSTKYGVSFPMFSKINVNGSSRHPLFEQLIGPDGHLPGNIKWNFSKILVNKDGTAVERFGSLTSPSSKKLRTRIDELLH